MANITIRYNVTGSERKRLADCIAGFLGCEKRYLGIPSYAYQVDYIEVSKDGAITFDDRADSDKIEALLEKLGAEGFKPEPAGEENDAPAAEEGVEASDEGPASEAPNAKPVAEEDASMDTTDEDDGAAQDADVGLTVRVPLGRVAVDNLKRLLAAKGDLIKKALGLKALPIKVEEDTVAFPWFEELPDADEINAYSHLIAAMCEMSKSLKRVTATQRAVDNEKYAFRCFLLRLGFIGAQYKGERKILLRNLSGSSAFKSGSRGGADDEVS